MSPREFAYLLIGSYAVTYGSCETRLMKNITVSVDEETYRLSRIKAAKSGTSVSALVRDYLVSLAQPQVERTEFARRSELQDETLDAIRARGGGLRSADNIPRRQLHERDALS